MTTTNPTTLTPDQMLALIAKLRDENAALAAKASAPRSLTCKVSEKGALSVYGLGRFPVTLYRGQWARLIAAIPQIEAFAKANANLLSDKAEA